MEPTLRLCTLGIKTTTNLILLIVVIVVCVTATVLDHLSYFRVPVISHPLKCPDADLTERRSCYGRAADLLNRTIADSFQVRQNL